MPHALKRIENVRAFRLLSKSEGTRKIADTPTRFHVENMPETGHYLLIPVCPRNADDTFRSVFLMYPLLQAIQRSLSPMQHYTNSES